MFLQLITVMKRFWNKGMKASLNGSAAAGRLGKAILLLQSRIAGWLNSRTSTYSPARWKWLLVLFCLISGGTFLYLIVSSIYS